MLSNLVLHFCISHAVFLQTLKSEKIQYDNIPRITPPTRLTLREKITTKIM